MFNSFALPGPFGEHHPYSWHVHDDYWADYLCSMNPKIAHGPFVGEDDCHFVPAAAAAMCYLDPSEFTSAVHEEGLSALRAAALPAARASSETARPGWCPSGRQCPIWHHRRGAKVAFTVGHTVRVTDVGRTVARPLRTPSRKWTGTPLIGTCK